MESVSYLLVVADSYILQSVITSRSVPVIFKSSVERASVLQTPESAECSPIAYSSSLRTWQEKARNNSFQKQNKTKQRRVCGLVSAL